MELKHRNALELYRTGPKVAPSAEMDAFVLAAARASPATAPRRRDLLVASAVAVAVAAIFIARVAVTPTPDLTVSGNGREEGLTRDWLINLDLQQPTGPGSQEGLP